MKDIKKNRVLVATLDWGIGHATRCVPLIRDFQNRGYEVILASNGTAKDFFKGYFPELVVLDKPGYNITYFKNFSMSISMLIQTPSIIKTIILEHQWLKKIIRQYDISEIISDNCYGLWNEKIHSVFITHQLRIKSPPRLKFSESFFQKIISFFISKYDACYIPDNSGVQNYSGELSHLNNLPSNARFIGTLSRFSTNESNLVAESYDLVILLSGPEPQRTILENNFEKLLSGHKKRCCIIRGLPGSKVKKENTEEFTWHNHLADDELKAVLKYSKKIICRPGYSTIMDLVELKVNAILVPTPGQTEQEYLADFNNYKRQFDKMSQNRLSLKKILGEINNPESHQVIDLFSCSSYEKDTIIE